MIRKYKEIRKNNSRRTSRILIWVDWDRYKRSSNSDWDNYQRKSDDIPDFLFSYMNFEDFLSMHCGRSDMQKWWTSCVGREHFTIPSHSSEYMPAFIDFIGGNYAKGDIPIDIDSRSLGNLRARQQDHSVPFKCDFAEELFFLMDAGECDQVPGN